MQRAQAEWADLPSDLGKPVVWWRHDPPDRHDLTIAGPAGPMVHVDLRTGRVEFGHGYDLDEAARLFWIGVGAQAPGLSAALTPNAPSPDARVLGSFYVSQPFVEGRRHPRRKVYALQDPVLGHVYVTSKDGAWLPGEFSTGEAAAASFDAPAEATR